LMLCGRSYATANRTGFIVRMNQSLESQQHRIGVAHRFNEREWLRWRIRDKDPLLGEGFVRVALCRHAKI
jgi:hypothetical protein